jgi:hypothetical protein
MASLRYFTTGVRNTDKITEIPFQTDESLRKGSTKKGAKTKKTED